ncbi:MAG: hypothetical protein EXR99_00955 [Gemmataceae bacterium]|nr:hypothetical protein [Gemmataceae bacterium]
MLEYDRYSFWKVTFSFSGTVLPGVLGRVGLLILFSLAICATNDFVLIPYKIPLPTLDQFGHTVLGTSVGLLIVFRTNSSSNRYWDGRSHWGMLVNTSRNLMRLANVYGKNSAEVATLITAYVLAVKEVLRGTRNFGFISNLLTGRIYTNMTKANNPPAYIAQAISEWIRGNVKDGQFDYSIAARMEELLSRLLDSQGGCEKILKTPLPFVYASFIKQLLVLYLFSLPFVLVPKMDWAAPLVIAALGFGLLGIEEAGVEIENPFGLQVNDLPLEKICEMLARDVNSLMELK